MPATHLFGGNAVSDVVAARPRYQALLGQRPDMRPTEVEAVWCVTRQGSVYVTADPPRAGRASVTIAVADLDGHAASLAARGVLFDERAADARTAQQLTVTDADGNCIRLFPDPARSAG